MKWKREKKSNRYRDVALRILNQKELLLNTETVVNEFSKAQHEVAPTSEQLLINTSKTEITHQVNTPHEQVQSIPTKKTKKAFIQKPKKQYSPGQFFLNTLIGVGKGIKWIFDTIFRFLNLVINTCLSLLDSSIWIFITIFVTIAGNVILFQMGLIEFNILDWMANLEAVHWLKAKLNIGKEL